MPILHMETELVGNTSSHIQQLSSMLQQESQQLSYSTQNLVNVWQGSSATVFIGNIQSLLNQLHQFADDGVILAQRLQFEVVEWEEISSSFEFNLGQSNVNLGALDSEYKAFDWLDWSISITGGFSALIDFQLKSYDSIKDIGRFLNKLAGSPRAGWVGRVDDLAHSLKDPNLKKIATTLENNKWLGAAADGVPLGLEIFQDVQQDGDWDKAIITEGFELVIEKALYAIPVVGPAFMIYDMALGVAHLGAGGLEMLGFHEQAVWLENTLEIIDPGEWIDKGLEWAYDEYLNDALTPVFDEVGEALTDFGSGLIDNAGKVLDGWFD
ncbi:MAG: hypothetical protein DWQ04_15585 [Chloroflexi bacterium]|nr:MAG: hypothetical protein DWQ04_15585 [Chloroflexota bacterium]